MVLEAENSTIKKRIESMPRDRSETSWLKQQPAPNSIEDCLEIVVNWIEQCVAKNYFVSPLDEFQIKYGKVNPEDDYYQSRMNYFLETCILERPMTGVTGGRSPASVFFGLNPHLTNDDCLEQDLWQKFCEFRHSMFKVVKSGQDKIVLKDLIAQNQLILNAKSGETLKYLNRDTIFQGYVFGHHNQYVLGQGIIIHPALANREIMKFIENHHKNPRFQTSEISRLMAHTNMRLLRMQHVNPAIIYGVISG